MLLEIVIVNIHLKKLFSIRQNGEGRWSLPLVRILPGGQFWTASNCSIGGMKRKMNAIMFLRGERLIAIEVKSGHAGNIDGYLAFRKKFEKDIVNSFIVGPEGLPVEDFFRINIPSLFRMTL